MEITYKLGTFEGPLDLLLHLIEKHKIDIYDIPIVMITEQFLSYMESMGTKDPESMSSFIVMAAMLLRIKTKMLLPSKEEPGEEADPREELVLRLLEYQKFKLLSQELKDRQIDAAQVFYRKKMIPKEVADFKEKPDPGQMLQGVTLEKLEKIFEEIMRRSEEKLDPVRSQFGKIEKEPVSLAERMQELEHRLIGEGRLSFTSLLEGERTRLNIIVTFLAVLELMKTGMILIKQEKMFGEIQIERK